KRFLGQPLLQVEELALSAAARELAVHDGGNARGIVAPIFKALQGIDKATRNRLISNDTDNSAHGPLRSLPKYFDCALFVEFFCGGATRPHSLSIAIVNVGAPNGLTYGAAFFFASLIAWLRSRMSTARPSLFSCRARAKATASSGTSAVMTLPDAI